MTNRWLTVVATSLVAVVTFVAPARAADPIRAGQWYATYLNLNGVHNVANGTGIVVAVLDTGVDSSHPALLGRVLPGTDLADARMPNGWIDEIGHGTGMASLLVGRGKIAGIAPGSKVLPVRVKINEFSPVALAEGIDWAVEHNASVISISIGASEPDVATKQAINRAVAADVVVVAAVGNWPKDQHIGYPAADPGVLAVGAIGQDGTHASFSVTGSGVDIVAPGAGCSTAWSNHSYAITDGTSNSTAIVAGAAALLRQHFPSMPAREIVHRLIATADDRGPVGKDDLYGYGVLNIYRALTEDVPPLEDSPSPAASPAVSTVGAPTQAAGHPGGLGVPIPFPLFVLIVLAVLIALAIGVARLAKAIRRRGQAGETGE